MSIWLRTIWVATVLILPGGFLLFLGFLVARTVMRIRHEALAQQPGQDVRLLNLLSRVRFQDLLREARASL
jgi:hypothetical protein